MSRSKRIGSIFGILAAAAALLYLGGLVGQIISMYTLYRATGSFDGSGGRIIVRPVYCFQSAITPDGLKGMAVVLVIAGAIFLYVKIRDRKLGDTMDPRGFKVAKNGTCGTASWMDDKERKTVLNLCSPGNTDEMILGESEQQPGKVFCLPKDTHLNRHVAIIGASGTMKSRAVIRNMLFQALKREESVIITDPKAELYADTAEMYRKAGYTVRVFNLIDPANSDSWNCMDDLLKGDTLLAQVLTNVVIGNTGSGRSDPFWDNGEGNLLKALVLYVACDPHRKEEEKNLAEAYRLLTQTKMDVLTKMFEELDDTHPAKAPWNLFVQSSETVRANFVTGLGSRLQVLQNDLACRVVSKSTINLELPAESKCAYYIIISDQDTTMSFLSSLFFTFMFNDLVRYADKQPDQRCPVPVNLILDEFNNVGRIGGAADGSDFCRALSTVRSRQIRVTIAVQSIGQLQNRYADGLWSEIMGNCDIQLMLGTTDKITAEYYSDRCGVMTVEDNSVMRTKQTFAAVQFIPEYRESLSQKGRPLMTPDEVLNLPNEEMLIIIRGHSVLRAYKFDYVRHPMAKKLTKVGVQKYETQDAPTSYTAERETRANVDSLTNRSGDTKREAKPQKSADKKPKDKKQGQGLRQTDAANF